MLTEIYNQGLTRRYEITIPAEQIGTALSEALQKKIQANKYPGFRPGKAPEWLVRKHETELLDNVIIDQVFKSWTALKKNKELKIFGNNEAIQAVNIEDYKKDNSLDIKYTVECEVAPEISNISTEDIILEEREFEVTDQDIENYINGIKTNASLEKEAQVSHIVREGDSLYVWLSGKIDGKPFKGGTQENLYLKVGEGKILDELEQGLVGMKKGEQKAIAATFPSDYFEAKLAGKNAIFDTKVNKILINTRIKTDEQLLEKFECKNLADLTEIIKKSLQRQCEGKIKKELIEKLNNLLVEKYDFLVPSSLIESQKKNIIEFNKYSNKNNSVDTSKASEEAEIEKKAKEHGKLSLLLSKFAQDNRIEIKPEEIIKYLFKSANYQEEYMDYFMDFYKNNKEFADKIAAKALEEKIEGEILSKVQKQKVKASVSEILDLKRQPKLNEDSLEENLKSSERSIIETA